MSSKLDYITAIDKNPILVRTKATAYYNAVEGRKTWHHIEFYTTPNLETVCFIWFTLHTPDVETPIHEYVGSKDIDPNDPNWREKWEAVNQPELVQPMNIQDDL